MENLAQKLKDCKVLVINGETYFGLAEIDRENDKITLTKAVEVTSKGNFKEVIKGWIKANNSDKLEQFTVTGLSTLTEKPLTEEQNMKIDSIAAQATYLMKTTITGLQNDAIDTI